MIFPNPFQPSQPGLGGSSPKWGGSTRNAGDQTGSSPQPESGLEKGCKRVGELLPLAILCTFAARFPIARPRMGHTRNPPNFRFDVGDRVAIGVLGRQLNGQIVRCDA